MGDIVQIREGEIFPADLILLSSSNPGGLTYISTASLDGEKNLKLRTVPKILLESVSPTDYSQIDAMCHS